MEILWTPWRSKYIDTFKDECNGEKSSACFLCEAVEGKGDDGDRLVVAKREHCFVILNKYPYNNGHLLIAPYHHVGEMQDLRDEELLDLTFTLRESIEALKMIYKPHGYNAGINLGRTAGAGVPEHLHFHIVPRWNGDTSFMATLSDVKIVSQSLEESQKLISEAFIKIQSKNV